MSITKFNNTVRIPLESLNSREISKLQDFFTVRVELDGKFQTDEYGEFLVDHQGRKIPEVRFNFHYAITDTHFILPKNVDLVGIIGRNPIEYVIENSEKVSNVNFDDVSHGITLRNEKQERCMEFLRENRGKDSLLCLSTGSGKTILSILYFIEENLKPVILCHNNTIISQWIEKCVAMGIPRSDIGIIRGAFRPRALKGKRVYIASSPTIEASISGGSERMKTMIANIRSLECDLMIVDEAHKLFNTVSKFSFYMNFHQKIYLTATPVRSLMDENAVVSHVLPFNNTLSIIEYEQPVDVVFFEFSSGATNKEIYYISLLDKYKFNNNRYVGYMLKKPENTYFRLVDYTMRRALKGMTMNERNKTLICGSTITQLEFLYEQFSSLYPYMKIKKFYGADKDSEVNKPFTGDGTDLILCVSKSIDAGFDNEDLTLMINLEYIKSESLLIQLKGRMARVYEGKKKAFYINMVDISIPFIRNRRYPDMVKVITDENKSKLYKINSGIVLPSNSKK